MSNIQLDVDPKKLVLDWMSSDAFIPVNKSVARKLGLRNAALLAETINQYKRWERKEALDPNGWFYWTEEDCEIETTLSRSTQRRAYTEMEEAKLFKRHYKKKYVDGKERKFRFIEVKFENIATLIFNEDEEFKKAVENKYVELRKRDKEHKEKAKEKAENLAMPEKVQNETSGSTKMELPIEASKWVRSKKESLNKKEFNKKELNNLSISEKVNNLNISDNIKSYLHKNQNRLTDAILNIVQSVFNMNLVTDDSIFIEKLEKTLDAKPQTQAFKSYFTKALNNSKNENTAQPASSTQNKVTRKEIVPTWLTEETEPSDDSSQVTESDSELEMYADLYKTTDCKLDAEIVQTLLAKGYLTQEDIKKEIA